MALGQRSGEKEAADMAPAANCSPALLGDCKQLHLHMRRPFLLECFLCNIASIVMLGLTSEPWKIRILTNAFHGVNPH